MQEENTQIRAIVVSPDVDLRERFTGEFTRQPSCALVAAVGTLSDGLDAIRKGQPNLLLLDVQLPDGNGFDVLPGLPPALRPQCVIISASAEDAVKAFEYSACDFLIKPITPQRLQLMWIKVRDRISTSDSAVLHEKLNALFRYINPQSQPKSEHRNGQVRMLPVKMSGRIYFIQPGEIEYIEAAGYYIEVFAGGKKHLIRQSLTQLEKFLDESQFIRIHRSVIINLGFLKEITRDGANDFSVRMANEAMFKISRSYKAEVFEKVGL